MRQTLPAARTVDRLAYLEEVVSGKRTIHVGFWGSEGCREVMQPHALWLHDRLSRKAAQLVGLDLNRAGVEQARQEGYEAHFVDCQDRLAVRSLKIDPADVVVAGEVIEHLDAPGPFLDAMHELVTPQGRLVITTPNAYSMLNPLSALRGIELVNPDHVALYSWYTLTNMLSRHGWRTSTFLTYPYPLPPGAASGRRWAGRSMARAILGLQRAVTRTIAPFLAHGLIATCQQDQRGRE
jgi:SAM-dependent methyltransferase